MLSSVGVTANVTTDYVEQDVETPVYEEHSIITGEERFPFTAADGST